MLTDATTLKEEANICQLFLYHTKTYKTVIVFTSLYELSLIHQVPIDLEMICNYTKLHSQTVLQQLYELKNINFINVEIHYKNNKKIHCYSFNKDICKKIGEKLQSFIDEDRKRKKTFLFCEDCNIEVKEENIIEFILQGLLVCPKNKTHEVIEKEEKKYDSETMSVIKALHNQILSLSSKRGDV